MKRPSERTLAEFIASWVEERTDEQARRDGQLTMDDLILLLDASPPELPVVVAYGDEVDLTPHMLCSYRGYYDRLAIVAGAGMTPVVKNTYVGETEDPFDLPGYGTYTPGLLAVDIAQPVTTRVLLGALIMAYDRRFEGYKGGQFTMSGSTYLHVATDRSNTGNIVVDARPIEGCFLITSQEEAW